MLTWCFNNDGQLWEGVSRFGTATVAWPGWGRMSLAGVVKANFWSRQVRPPRRHRHVEDFRENDSPNFRLYDVQVVEIFFSLLPRISGSEISAQSLINLVISINQTDISREGQPWKSEELQKGEKISSQKPSLGPCCIIKLGPKVSNFEP